MSEEIKDPGIGTQFSRSTKRIINSDGSYNIIRKGTEKGFRDVYKYLTEISWTHFFLILFASYVFMNLLFTMAYMICGFDHINGIEGKEGSTFLNAFYFSVQTFTTVGYGVMSPSGPAAQTVAAIEAFVGFLSFALATGLLYGRFSRPTSKLIFSDKLLYSKHRDGYALKIKLVNGRDSVPLDVEARVILTIDEPLENGDITKRYYRLPLELPSVQLMPFTWTLVHKIDEESPLHDMSKEQILNSAPEFLVLIKGYTEVFGQEIHSRKSYTAADLEWNKNFQKIFKPNEDGVIEMDVRDINMTEDE